VSVTINQRGVFTGYENPGADFPVSQNAAILFQLWGGGGGAQISPGKQPFEGCGGSFGEAVARQGLLAARAGDRGSFSARPGVFWKRVRFSTGAGEGRKGLACRGVFLFLAGKRTYT